MGKKYIDIGFFEEMQFKDNCGSVFDWLTSKNELNYDKNVVLNYLKKHNKAYAGCPRAGIDCVNGDVISQSFQIFTDGVFDWCDFLIYHINKYNIRLPQKFVDHIKQSNSEKRGEINNGADT